MDVLSYYKEGDVGYSGYNPSIIMSFYLEEGNKIHQFHP